MELNQKKCVPCEGNVPRLNPEEIARLMPQLRDWQVGPDHRKLNRRFIFDDFRQAMAFVNQMADLAEAEGHHPDFTVHYSVVDVILWTHAIGGLSENDFIMAAKIDKMTDKMTDKKDRASDRTPPDRSAGKT
jgi:4a-hydroxytetrahydrobiopterin dehydratase